MNRGSIWIANTVDEYTCYLKSRGMLFTEDGFPLFSKQHFLEEWPDAVVTYKYRESSLVREEGKTLLCHYAPDDQILPRFDKLYDELDTYRLYMGAAMPDLTVTWDMNPAFQAEVMLLNQLYAAVLAVNGVKIAANTRCGALGSMRHLRSIPKGVMWISGFLGCERETDPANVAYVGKILSLRPSKLLIYGKSDRVVEDQLNRMGVDFRRFPDVHALYKSRGRREGERFLDAEGRFVDKS